MEALPPHHRFMRAPPSQQQPPPMADPQLRPSSLQGPWYSSQFQYHTSQVKQKERSLKNLICLLFSVSQSSETEAVIRKFKPAENSKSSQIMEEDGDPTIPFWLQTSNNLYRHRHRRQSSILLNPTLLIVLLPIFALILLVFVIPSILSFASLSFRSSSVKKNWDSLNFLLVLFAIACGFLNRRSNDDSSSSSFSNTGEANGVPAHIAEAISENPLLQSTTPRHQWFEYSSDPRIYDSLGATTSDSISTNVVRLKRNCSSYPDLRRDISSKTGAFSREILRKKIEDVRESSIIKLFYVFTLGF